MLMSNDKIQLSAFLVTMNKLAKQKLKESDYKHVADIISMSSHDNGDK